MLAIGIRLLGAASAGCLYTLVKLAGDHHVALAQLMFWRFLMSVPLVAAYLAWRGQLYTLRTDRLGAHVLRGSASTFTLLLNFGATMLLPIAMVTTFNFTTPLFGVLIAAMVLRQRVSGWNWLAVVLGFGGVLLVAQPSPGETISHLGAASALAGAAMVAITNLQVRSLGQTEQPTTIVFYFSLFGTMLSACALPFYPLPTTATQWLLLLALGLCGLAVQLFMALSLRFGQVSTLLVMDYSILIWATLAGWLVWDHLPSVTAWIGAPLIVGSGLMIAWRAHRGQRGPASLGPDIAAELRSQPV